ncbi:sialate O-acetylesterase [Pedobacter sp. SYSU D00535]|uniref:sialate O-acetylesterase n=1 Tax=Pedobacter sp. SYSU D00535 TaxID=2810308 RepID=UPI001A95A64A|nr:sialate O-acetylesterase [Pedobacter sp. SYSU D00535]
MDLKKLVIRFMKLAKQQFYLPVALSMLLLLLSVQTHAQVQLPKLFGQGMVLQREADIPVWGSAAPGSQVVVELGKNRVKAVAGPDGKWKLQLPAMKAGGPYVMTVYEGSQPVPAIRFEEVLIGDAWLASGQSNIEWQVQQSMNAGSEIKAANYPNIRFFIVPHDKSVQVKEDVKGGSWKAMDSVHVKTASAVAYYFAKSIQADLKIPIGIIQSTWGGTPVEAWTSREQLLRSESSRKIVLQNDSVTEKHFIKDSLDLIRFWDIVYHPKNLRDKTIPQVSFDDSEWPELPMPNTLKDWPIPFYEGMVWMRKTFELPEGMAGKELHVELGRPEMNYSLYINGHEISRNVWNANLSHRYRIPPGHLKPGKNVLAVRMAFLWGGGGFHPPASQMYLTDGKTNISLAGNWKYMKDLEPAIPKINNYHRYPNYLYNAMIHPLIPYGLKGFLWYQGEDNVSDPLAYRSLFPMLMEDWRNRWKQGNLAFLYVQLANYLPSKVEPAESNWAALREAQTMALSQANTGMACIIDIGEAGDIHPKNKHEVGRRLALVAKNKVYKQPVQSSGPLFQQQKIEGDKIRLRFSEIGSGLALRGAGPLKGFAIAGSDRKFYWAEAMILGNEVIVSSGKVRTPVAVRYAWADNPDGNLINKEGLPAVPFRTDDWSLSPEK